MVQIKENNVTINLTKDHLHPKTSVPYFNPKMKINREFVLLTLESLVDFRDDIIECFDGFGASGVMSLQWKKSLGNKIKVFTCDVHPDACFSIRSNAVLNNLTTNDVTLLDLTDDRPNGILDMSGGDIHLLNTDSSLVMMKKSFDFIHLDPFGTTVPFLDGAFRNLRQGGIITLTSTDVASLFARNPQVVVRNYSATVIKTEYNRELAARVIIASAVRSAARCNKGINVLYSCAAENFILVALQVVRGTKNADRSLNHLSQLLHCRLCQDRVFLTSRQMTPLEQPYSLLPCCCKAEHPGKTAVLLGPMWNANLFNVDFVHQMVTKYKIKTGINSENSNIMVSDDSSNPPKTELFSLKMTHLLSMLFSEAQCGLKNEVKVTTTEKTSNNCLKRTPDLNIETFSPAFHYTPTRLKLSGTNIPKIETIQGKIRSAGFICSRTHFDSTALRTNANHSQLKAVIQTDNTTS